MVRARRIAEVAAAAGVSPTTVSHALSGRRSVAPATRERILKVADELNYRPSKLASGLRTQRTHTLAFVVPDIANPYYTSAARALHDGVSGAGFMTLIGNTDGVSGQERAVLREMISRGVDGIVFHSLSTSTPEVREIVGPDFPVVVVGGTGGPVATDLVITDDAVGIGEAVRHLHSSGVRTAGFVSGPSSSGPGNHRLAEFIAAAHALQIRVDQSCVVHAASYSRSGGFTAAAPLLAQQNRPEAIMCANDLLAIGVLDAARATNLAVPGELAVVGFDDIETADLVTPRLTTVNNPAALAGATSARRVLELVERGPGDPYQIIALPTSLVVRASA